MIYAVYSKNSSRGRVFLLRDKLSLDEAKDYVRELRQRFAISEGIFIQ